MPQLQRPAEVPLAAAVARSPRAAEVGASALVAPKLAPTLSLPLTPTPAAPQREIGGPPGPEPTRYGDWEKNGRCIDF